MTTARETAVAPERSVITPTPEQRAEVEEAYADIFAGKPGIVLKSREEMEAFFQSPEWRGK